MLEQLGYKINQTVDEIIDAVTKTNFGYCFAPNFHPVLSRIREIRNSLGIPTIFNLIGPMCNPANAEYLVLGVYDPKRVDLVAKTLLQLGTKRSIVFSATFLEYRVNPPWWKRAAFKVNLSSFFYGSFLE